MAHGKLLEAGGPGKVAYDTRWRTQSTVQIGAERPPVRGADKGCHTPQNQLKEVSHVGGQGVGHSARALDEPAGT